MQGVFGYDLRRSVGQGIFLAVSLRLARMQAEAREALRVEGDADTGGAGFVLRRRAVAVFSGEQLYVLFRGEGDVFSFDRRALDGEVALCGGDACLFSGRDCAACIFPGNALGTAVRFVCAEAEIQRKVRVVLQGIVFAEVFMDEAAGFPCVGGFQAVVLHFPHAHERRSNLLPEAQESMTEADSESRRLAVLAVSKHLRILLSD